VSHVSLRIVHTTDSFIAMCPKCKNVAYSGNWHVALEIDKVPYFVGEMLRCTECSVRFRCQAVFLDRAGAEARLQTVAGIVAHFESVKPVELFEIPEESQIFQVM